MRRRCTLISLPALLLPACASPEAEDLDSAVVDYDLDQRMTEADLPELPDNAQIWWGPEVVIEPYSESMYCLFGTYSEADIALDSLQFWQGEFGHHLQLFGTTTNVLDVPDGTVVDCTDGGGEAMTSMEPMLIADAFNGHVFEEMVLPEGMAYKLREGQRWVLQAHYLNTSADRILVKDPAVVYTQPVEDVETWVAPLVINHGEYGIPPGQAFSSDYGCTFEEDFHLLYILGHMHEYGTAMSIQTVTEAGTDTLYEVDAWETVFRDDPPVTAFEEPLLLSAGTELNVSCTWFNTTDADLAFPAEMCVSVSMAYPALTDTICSD